MNEKWFLCDIADVEKKLKTNAASGLSPKAARSRYRKGSSSFYIMPKKKVSTMLCEIMADFSLVLLIICSVIALCFSEYLSGITLTVITLLNLLACLFLYFRAQRMFESLSSLFRPSVTAVRSGKAYLCDAEHIVPGDVVILSEGDILPFDCRLVTSDNLRVMVRVDRETEEAVEKFAEGHIRENENDIRAMYNMVHAGSRIISGSARAIVIATGRYTYYGAMTGGVKIDTRVHIPRGLQLLRKYCTSFSLAITALTLPFSIISLIFSHGNVTLMTTFSAALAIAASSMSRLSCTVCRIFFERGAREGLSGANGCVIRSAEIMDRLVSVEYLFMLDGSATSDGVLHYHRAICAEGEWRDNRTMTSSVKNLSELVALYHSAEKNTLTTGVYAPGRFRGALAEFVENTGVDSEALKIRCNILGYIPGNSKDDTDKLFYNDRGRKYILNVSQSRDVIASCTRAYLGGSVKNITDEGRASLAQVYDRWSGELKPVLVFTISENEFSADNIFAGMLVLSENEDAAAKNALARIRKMGVKVISFRSSRKGSGVASSELPAPILSSVARNKDFEVNSLPYDYKFGELDTYIDLDANAISLLISRVHKEGKRVAMLGFSNSPEEFSEQPDLFITCSEQNFRFAGRFEEEIEEIEVPGGAESRSCRQDLKVKADVMIPRPRRSGEGGLMSLGRAFALAGKAYNNLSGFFRYVLCSQFIRLVMVMLPMIFGEAYLDARHALFCGSVIDIFVMLIFAFEKCGIENAKGFRSITGEFKMPIRNNAGMIIASSAGALCAVILPNIVALIGFAGPYYYQSEYLFVSMILLHLTVMYCIRIDNLRRFGQADVNPFGIALLVFSFLFILLCFTVEQFGYLFEILEITLPYLLLTAVPAALCAVLYFVIGNFRIKVE